MYLNSDEAVAMANLDFEIKMEEYVQVHTLERKKNKGTQEKAHLLPSSP